MAYATAQRAGQGAQQAQAQRLPRELVPYQRKFGESLRTLDNYLNSLVKGLYDVSNSIGSEAIGGLTDQYANGIAGLRDGVLQSMNKGDTKTTGKLMSQLRSILNPEKDAFRVKTPDGQIGVIRGIYTNSRFVGKKAAEIEPYFYRCVEALDDLQRSYNTYLGQMKKYVIKQQKLAASARGKRAA